MLTSKTDSLIRHNLGSFLPANVEQSTSQVSNSFHIKCEGDIVARQGSGGNQGDGQLVHREDLHRGIQEGLSSSKTLSSSRNLRYSDKSITINCVLDSPDIPYFVLEYLMFHEMLHAVMPGAGASSSTYWWRRSTEQSRSNR